MTASTPPAAAAAGNPAGNSVAHLRGGTIGYDERPVLHDVTFRLDPGEVVAVLGPNGSGKSTLVKGLLGLAPLLAGTLELFGTPADRFADRGRLGYVPQRLTVGGGLPVTVTEVVSCGRLARRRRWGRQRADDVAAVRAAVDVVGLSGRAHDPVATLSGGQQRRVLIARALAAQPDVLVMDEPMAGVDAAHQAALADTLRRLAAGGTTMLIVAHELGPVGPLVSRVVQLRDGRIASDTGRRHGGPGRAGDSEADPHCAGSEGLVAGLGPDRRATVGAALGLTR